MSHSSLDRESKKKHSISNARNIHDDLIKTKPPEKSIRIHENTKGRSGWKLARVQPELRRIECNRVRASKSEAENKMASKKKGTDDRVAIRLRWIGADRSVRFRWRSCGRPGDLICILLFSSVSLICMRCLSFASFRRWPFFPPFDGYFCFHWLLIDASTSFLYFDASFSAGRGRRCIARHAMRKPPRFINLPAKDGRTPSRSRNATPLMAAPTWTRRWERREEWGNNRRPAIPVKNDGAVVASSFPFSSSSSAFRAAPTKSER